MDVARRTAKTQRIPNPIPNPIHPQFIYIWWHTHSTACFGVRAGSAEHSTAAAAETAVMYRPFPCRRGRPLPDPT